MDPYIRFSDLRDSDLSADGSAENIEHAKRTLVARIRNEGHRVGEVIVENDVDSNGRLKPASAYQRKPIKLADGTVGYRVLRPGFQRLLARVKSGQSHGVYTLDLDRLARDPRDLEDMIDVWQATGAQGRSLSGSLTFTNGGTDGEITMARLLVTMAWKSSRDTARRVALARQRKAELGQFGGGQRRYGFEPDGITRRERECKVIAQCATKALAGIPLGSLAVQLNDRGIPTATGKSKWTDRVLRDVLLRPRNAGYWVHRGEIMGRGSWRPIIDESVWLALVELLTDESRVSQPGPKHQYLGSALYQCNCGAPVTTRMRSYRVYACSDQRTGSQHVKRSQADVDTLVEDVVLSRLARSDAAKLLRVPARKGVDVAALRERVHTLRTAQDELAAAFGAGEMTRSEWRKARERNAVLLDATTSKLRDQAGESPLSPLIGVADPRAVWRRLPIAERRAVVAALVTVTIRPLRPGACTRNFDPASVEIVFNKPAR